MRSSRWTSQAGDEIRVTRSPVAVRRGRAGSVALTGEAGIVRKVSGARAESGDGPGSQGRFEIPSGTAAGSRAGRGAGDGTSAHSTPVCHPRRIALLEHDALENCWANANQLKQIEGCCEASGSRGGQVGGRTVPEIAGKARWCVARTRGHRARDLSGPEVDGPAGARTPSRSVTGLLTHPASAWDWDNWR